MSIRIQTYTFLLPRRVDPPRKRGCLPLQGVAWETVSNCHSGIHRARLAACASPVHFGSLVFLTAIRTGVIDSLVVAIHWSEGIGPVPRTFDEGFSHRGAGALILTRCRGAPLPCSPLILGKARLPSAWASWVVQPVGKLSSALISYVCAFRTSPIATSREVSHRAPVRDPGSQARLIITSVICRSCFSPPLSLRGPRSRERERHCRQRGCRHVSWEGISEIGRLDPFTRPPLQQGRILCLRPSREPASHLYHVPSPGSTLGKHFCSCYEGTASYSTSSVENN